METRELRYFVAVAEELHFGRAAGRLGIAQPPLSRAIQQVERRLGVELLERTPRAVTLTAAGRVLLDEARAALAAVEAAERRTVRAAAGSAGIVLTVKAGSANEVLAELLDAFAAEPDAVPVEVALVGPGEPEAMLRDGRADVALLHLPMDSTAGFDAEELLVEDQVAVLPAGHPLSARDHLELADLTGLPDLPLPRWPRPDPNLPEPTGPEIRDHLQLLQLVALRRTCAILPPSAIPFPREGIALVPLVDAVRVTTAIAWPAHSRSRAVAALVRTATA
ncbi:LysR family transcriptional regulator [Kineococcus rhizosphaerae]|uniref:LysR family transcriptional regulator n=1 Tax=Kineococcus rhizosphaerae TaxID=559628 RepID=A0A2T0R6A1_9ACTN|nr:LysR family transcriptional regulator [Kineococcus rhizosphaerae]PRY16685.1 LysR family transcriptional regulator [Kineococcus rhizosphaerae]